jgi:hypothetical protein
MAGPLAAAAAEPADPDDRLDRWPAAPASAARRTWRISSSYAAIRENDGHAAITRELDYYLHENPEQKRAAYTWLTDFVGWPPMPDGGEREAMITADYNAEMIEHIARYPQVRDRAIFVGEPADIVPGTFGAGLPEIRDWTERHYDFAGYVTGFDPRQLGDRHALGYCDDERVRIVTVGGSGVGGHLLPRVIAAFPEAKDRVPDLRMIVVGRGSTLAASRLTTAWKCAPTSTNSTATSPPATSPSSRAA